MTIQEIKPEPNRDIVEELEYLLAAAMDGDLVEFAYVRNMKGDGYDHGLIMGDNPRALLGEVVLLTNTLVSWSIEE